MSGWKSGEILTKAIKSIALFALLLCSGFSQHIGAQTDSLHLSIEGTTIVSSRNTSVIRRASSGVMNVNMEILQNLPQIFGNTDPLRFARLLPGIQTNSEIDSGIHIQGCDNAHNEISIEGIPLYGVNHLLGFFSVFNPSHYGKMSLSNISSSNRLGGAILMELPDTLKQKFSADVTVGMMSSQGTLGVRIGNKSHLKLSARTSYLDLLYKRWMKLKHSQFDYGFSDYNLTYVLVPSDQDKLWADFYYGRDAAGLDEISYNIDLTVGWQNLLSALHYEHKGSVWQKHSLFYSGYSSQNNVLQEESNLSLYSYIMSVGYKGRYKWNDFSALTDVTGYHVLLQRPALTGIYASSSNGTDEFQNAMESSVSLHYNRNLSYALNLSAGLKGLLYVSPEAKLYYGVSPDISLTYDMYQNGKVKGSYGWNRQYIFQTGLSNIGFPMEFWVLSGKYSDPQCCQYVDLSYETGLFNDIISFSAGAYCKRLYNLLEYEGDLFDMLQTKYDLEEKLLKGKGWNYGVNVMLHKQSGDFTGWVNYSLGRSVRSFDNPSYQGYYPSNHERIHDLHVMGSYKTGSWNLSGTFVFASGLPYTAPSAFHMSSGHLIVDYGRHNGCRMRPYIRMDVSATYYLKKDAESENGLNFSIYNVFARKNDVIYRLYTDEEGYVFRPNHMPLNFMPSISYFHKF